MKGQEIKFKTLEIESNSIFDESDIMPDGVEPEQHLKNLIEKFNMEERRRHKINPQYPLRLRKLVSFDGMTGKIKPIIQQCDFGDKINTVTVSRGNLCYDLYRCKNCKIVGRRFGFAALEITCYPERSCEKCNKVFANEGGLKNHNERGKHKLPDWYPDGV